jgi:ankyrin repeat protein
LELLLEAGADANKQNNAGDTPLHKAVAKTSLPCIKALIVRALSSSPLS